MKLKRRFLAVALLRIVGHRQYRVVVGVNLILDTREKPGLPQLIGVLDVKLQPQFSAGCTGLICTLVYGFPLASLPN